MGGSYLLFSVPLSAARLPVFHQIIGANGVHSSSDKKWGQNNVYAIGVREKTATTTTGGGICSNSNTFIVHVNK